MSQDKWKRLRSLMSKSLNISAEKFNGGIVDLFKDIDAVTKKLSIDYLIIGATARDIVLVHGFNAKIERGTKDIDFGIYVSRWEDFNAIKTELSALGYIKDAEITHRFHRKQSDGLVWEMDIIPFGAIAGSDKKIAWPPKHDIKMSVLGFSEALRHTWKVTIDSESQIIIPVSSPTSVVILKLIAWTERESQNRIRDAYDIIYIIHYYQQVDDIFDALYDDGIMEQVDYDLERACAFKIGMESKEIFDAETLQYLEGKIFNHHGHMLELASEMSKRHETLEVCKQLIEDIRAGMIYSQ